MHQNLFGQLFYIPGLILNVADEPRCELLLFGDTNIFIRNWFIRNSGILFKKNQETVKCLKQIKLTCFHTLMCLEKTATFHFDLLGHFSWLWAVISTYISILEQLNLKRELLQSIKRRKLRFYGHAYRADGIAKTVICGIYPEKRRRGRPRR